MVTHSSYPGYCISRNKYSFECLCTWYSYNILEKPKIVAILELQFRTCSLFIGLHRLFYDNISNIFNSILY